MDGHHKLKSFAQTKSNPSIPNFSLEQKHRANNSYRKGVSKDNTVLENCFFEHYKCVSLTNCSSLSPFVQAGARLIMLLPKVLFSQTHFLNKFLLSVFQMLLGILFLLQRCRVLDTFFPPNACWCRSYQQGTLMKRGGGRNVPKSEPGSILHHFL